MSYSNKRRAAEEKIHGKQKKAAEQRAAPRANGNMPNQASLNPQRKRILAFVRAVSRCRRPREAIFHAMSQYTPEQLKALIEAPAGGAP